MTSMNPNVNTSATINVIITKPSKNRPYKQVGKDLTGK